MARDTFTTEPERTSHYGDSPPPRSEPPQGRGGNGALIGVLALLLAGAVIWALIATFSGSENSGGAEAGITLSELTSDPEGLYGSTVVVSGEISDVIGAEDEAITAQTTAATGFVLGDDERVLVVGSQIPQLAALRGEQDLADGDVVQVTGTVREFDIAALEEDLGVDLANDEFSVFDQRPVLMASAVHLVPTSALQQGEQIALTADELTDSPGEYLAMRLTVRDVTVDNADVLSPRAVALDDDVLVIGASGPTNMQAGFTGTVTGTLIEASTARLLNTIEMPQNADAADLFEEIGIDEQQFGEYEYVLVANRFQRGG